MIFAIKNSLRNDFLTIDILAIDACDVPSSQRTTIDILTIIKPDVCQYPVRRQRHQAVSSTDIAVEVDLLLSRHDL